MTITLICALLIISLCQATILPHLSIYDVTPDFFLVMTVFVSLNTNIKQASVINWINGFAKDLFSLAPFGFSAFLFVLIGYFIGRSREYVFKDHPLTQILITFLAALFYGFGYLFVMMLSNKGINLIIILQKVFCGALYSSFISILLFMVLKKYRDKLGLSEVITFERKS